MNHYTLTQPNPEELAKLKQGGQTLGKALLQRQNEIYETEQSLDPTALCRLMTLCHQRFILELDTFSMKKCIQTKKIAQEKMDKLLGKNPTRQGNLWTAFRYYKRVAIFLGQNEKACESFIETYVSIQEQSAKTALLHYQKSDCEMHLDELLFSDFFNMETYLSEGLVATALQLKTPMEISKQLEPILRIDPKEEYPLARSMCRHFTIHVGGTNTGKTYGSIKRLKESKSGYYLAPLRLLALEVQETLREAKVNCGMITGEDEDLHPSNTHISSTVEKINLREVVEVAVIDECQMIADHDRGYAWTRAILGCPSREIHCCVALEGLDILKKVIEYCDCTYTVEAHQRLVPLVYQDSPVPLEEARAGDAFVAFSRREVLRIANLLTANGTKASVIYGALPYKARKLQMNQFLSGDTSVLVATDAIGMGLNLPIKRVIFTANEKFDGHVTRILNIPEVKQIGGRAGRFGKYPKGYLTTTSRANSVKRQFHGTARPHTTARLGFTDQILDLDYELDAILDAWQKTDTPEPFVKTDVSRHIKMIGLLREYHFKLSKSEQFKAISIPFNEDKDELLDQFFDYLRLHRDKAKVMPMPVLTSKFAQKSPNLMDYELYDKQLDLYYAFSSVFHYPYDKQTLSQEKINASERINQLLMEDMETSPELRERILNPKGFQPKKEKPKNPKSSSAYGGKSRFYNSRKKKK